MKTKPISLWTYALIRNTLAVEVPHGWPRDRGEILLEVIGTHEQCKPVIDSLWWPGSGYSCHCSPLAVVPVRRLSQSAKASVRRKSLRRRLEKEAPLFAESLERDALASDADYYNGEEYKR